MDERNVSINVLRKGTVNKLSALLNPVKHFLSEEKLSRDWRGLAELCDIDSTLLPSIQQSSNQTEQVLELWKNKNQDYNVNVLLNYLEKIDRHDIVEDIIDLIDEDIIKYRKNPNGYTPENTEADFDILTHDDAQRKQMHQQGPQIYDAFVLFADDDISFATELIKTMEDEYDLKFCVKDRDLVGGTFINSAIIKIIKERCRKLIVILSEAFLRSPQKTFFYSFAQTLEIDQRQKKIIPCSAGPVRLPLEYSCYVIMDYKRAQENNLYNFWEKLCSTIKIPTDYSERTTTRIPSIKITPALQANNNKDLDAISVAAPQQNGLKSSLHTNNNNMKSTHSVSFKDLTQIPEPQMSQSVSDNNLDGIVKKKKNKNFIKKILGSFPRHKTAKMATN